MNSTNSFSSTLLKMLSDNIDDVCLTKGVLGRIPISQNVSVGSLIESDCDKLDDMKSASVDVGEKKKPAKRWFKGCRVLAIR